jgi:CheY-like chemotaxis protein
MTDRPVLVVEDDADTRHMVEAYLTFQGVPVVTAENGAEALAALSAHRPSLILLDLSMPVMDGWRFREEQRRLADDGLAAIPVVVVSALADQERHVARIGAVDVIPKPVDFDRMLDAVHRFRDSRGE